MTDNEHVKHMNTPVTVPLTMTPMNFLNLMDTATPWSVADAWLIEQGHYEPVQVKGEGPRMDWTTCYWYVEAVELILAQSFLAALGEDYEVIYDASDFADPGPDDPDPEDDMSDWPRYRLLTNYRAAGTPWETCKGCGLPSGEHFGDCSEYPAFREAHPQAPQGPVPPRLRDVTVVPFPERFGGSGRTDSA